MVFLFRKYYSDSQLLYAQLDITTFSFIVANDKLYGIVAFATFQVLIYNGTIAINYFCMPYFNLQLLYASLLFTAFVCAIVNGKLFMHYYNSRPLLYVLLQLKMLFQQYYN